jgi:hypothetical protein
MKTKRFLLAAGFSLATAFIVSCGTHSLQDFLDELGLGDNFRDKIKGLTSNNLLQNGRMGFVSGDQIPGSAPGSVDVIDTVIVNGRAVEGGSTSITVIATEELEELYISIEGEDGYYVQALSEYDPTEDGKYSYFFVLQFNQELAKLAEGEEVEIEGEEKPSKEMLFTLSGKTKNGEIVKETEDEKIVIKKAESGALQISVSWDQLDDVDLHVFTPSGGHVYFGNKEAGNVKLDFDANAACIETRENWGVNSENIYVDAPIEDGEYTIELRMYQKCDTNPKIGARYHVTANYDGKFIDFAPREQTGQFAASATGNEPIAIGTIIVSNGRVVN